MAVAKRKMTTPITAPDPYSTLSNAVIYMRCGRTSVEFRGPPRVIVQTNGKIAFRQKITSIAVAMRVGRMRFGKIT